MKKVRWREGKQTFFENALGFDKGHVLGGGNGVVRGSGERSRGGGGRRERRKRRGRRRS